MIDWFKRKKFNEILKEHLDSLVRFAYVRCHDRGLAEDLVQEACIKAYKAFSLKGNEIIKPKEWLFRILINTHISYLRKKNIEIVDDFNLENCDVAINNENNDENNLDLDQEREILEEDLNLSLSKLSKDQRQVVYLVDVKGYSFKEASNVLGIPFGTLTSRLHRGRLKLKKVLTELGYSKGSLEAGGYGLQTSK